MTRSDRQLLRRVSVAGLVVMAAVLVVWALGWLRQVEGGLYDLRAQQFQYFTPKPTDRLVHVDIDDTTLDAIGSWPWPRSIMAELIDEMALAQAKVIALDILYTQEQKPEWQPTDSLLPAGVGGPSSRPSTQPSRPSTQPSDAFTLIDHDARLAASFRKAGNLLMAASLQFRPSRPQTEVMARAVALLRATPSLSPDEMVKKLVEGGASTSEVSEASEIFYALRREAVQDRIESEMVAAGSSAPTTRPADAREVAPDEDPVIIDYVDRLFPGRQFGRTTPEYRVVEEAYGKARGLASLDSFSRPLAPGVTAFKPRGELPPVPKLIEAAGYSGFVDYPPLADGTVRSVPLFVEHHGKLFSQMGLRIACALLDIDPASVQIEQDAITLPASTDSSGTSRPALRVPLRVASQTFQSGRRVDFPLLMDIPWFGTEQWETMYDPTQPNLKKQHFSMAAVYAAVRSRQKLERSLIGADRAARDLVQMLSAFMPENAATFRQYDSRTITGKDTAADTATLEWLLGRAAEIGIEPGVALDANATEADRAPVRAVRALADAKSELPALQAELADNRKVLRDNLAGKAALVGWASTWQVADTYPTPLHESAPGVVVHGVIVNALLTGDVWRAAPVWSNAIIAILFGLVTTFAVARLSPGRAIIAATSIAAAFVVLNGLLFFDYANVTVESALPLFVGSPGTELEFAL